MLREYELRITLGLYMMPTEHYISPIRVHMELYNKIETKVWYAAQNSIIRDLEKLGGQA